jgi:hypothetical protein
LLTGFISGFDAGLGVFFAYWVCGLCWQSGSLASDLGGWLAGWMGLLDLLGWLAVWMTSWIRFLLGWACWLAGLTCCLAAFLAGLLDGSPVSLVSPAGWLALLSSLAWFLAGCGPMAGWDSCLAAWLGLLLGWLFWLV